MEIIRDVYIKQDGWYYIQYHLPNSEPKEPTFYRGNEQFQPKFNGNNYELKAGDKISFDSVNVDIK